MHHSMRINIKKRCLNPDVNNKQTGHPDYSYSPDNAGLLQQNTTKQHHNTQDSRYY
jgi:hypothetical protein